MAPAISRRSLLRTGALVAMVGTAGCLGNARFDVATSVGESWPLARYDPAGTAHNPHASPPRTIAIDWWTAINLEFGITALIVAEETVVVGSPHHLVAMNATTGDIRWQKNTGAKALGYRDGTLYTAEGHYGARAFRLADGTQRWRTEFADVVYGLVPTAATVLIAVHNQLLCLDATTGDRQWKIGTRGGSGNTGIAITGGTAIHTDANVVTASEPSHLPDVIHSGPNQVWQTDWKELRPDRHTFSFPRPPCVAGGRVYVGEANYLGKTDAQVYAFSAADGHLIWQTESFGKYASTPALAGGRGYFFTSNRGESRSFSGALGALVLDTGKVEWTKPLPQYGSTGQLAVADGVVVCCGARSGKSERTQGIVSATKTGTGERLWQADTEGSADVLALVDEWVYVGTGTGTVYRFGTK